MSYDGDEATPSRNHNLLLVETRDALDNLITVKTRDDNNQIAIRNDYRVLQPCWITDANGNRTRVVFDALGLVTATAIMGKPEQHAGDTVEDAFSPDLMLAEIREFVSDPRAQAQGLVGHATSRIVYDLDRYQRCGQPPFASILAREIHFHDQGGNTSPVQISLVYSDGFGREIQTKVQAEAGAAPQRGQPAGLVGGDIEPGALIRDRGGKIVEASAAERWAGTGRIVYNNKGKPIKKYEPFLSSTHLYEPEPEMTDTGVTPILFYDPAERVVATLHPNHTYEKVVFDPWQQTTFDVNDTLYPPPKAGDPPFDPKTDMDVGGYFVRLSPNEYLPTWLDLRTDPAKALRQWPDTSPDGTPIRENAARRAAEKRAAEKAARHAGTPTTAHFDALGRTFLTIVHNRFDRESPSGAVTTVEESYPTRLMLDIEGNQREVWDEWTNAQGDREQRVVMRYDYDMLGNRIRQASLEAGKRWMLNDVLGKPIRAWDSRSFTRRMTYDALRRPIDLLVAKTGVERLAERIVYGESRGDAKNHRARVYQTFDGAGVVTNESYDFKGNLTLSKRELLPDYEQAVNWRQNPSSNDGTFVSSTEYDALNRPTTVTTPDNSVYRATFNRANLLGQVNVNLGGASPATSFVTNIDYNAKGQRTLIGYGNGAQTTYEYDDKTFRLIHLKTTRPAGLNGLAAQLFVDATVVQDLYYAYDPVGNITHISDAALPTIQHNGESVHPEADYVYDAIYRLISAQGREHIGQTAFDLGPTNQNNRDYPFFGLHASSNDPQSVRNYTETFRYDEVGNISTVRHTAKNGDWTRTYIYNEASLLETTKNSNRLTRTQVGNGINFLETYSYTDAQGNDVDGCMTSINAMAMTWDFKDELQSVNLGGGGTAYYVYDASGQRVRKVIHNLNNKKSEERIYVGGYEIYREHDGSGNTTPKLERHTLHVMDDKQRIALVETRTDTPTPEQLIRYQFANHLGSSALELDDQARVISYEEYHPYGMSSFQAMRSQTEAPKRFRYTGKERDEETELYYHGARYYAPWIGRWVSCDPIPSKNSYLYSLANPVVLLDPSGREPKVSLVLSFKMLLRYDASQISDPDKQAAAAQERLALEKESKEQKPSENSSDSSEKQGKDPDPRGDSFLGKFRDFFRISKAEKLETEGLSDEGGEKLYEARTLRAKGTEGAGEILAESGDVVMMAIPGPGGGESESAAETLALRKEVPKAIARGPIDDVDRLAQEGAEQTSVEVMQRWRDFLPQAKKIVQSAKAEYKNVEGFAMLKAQWHHLATNKGRHGWKEMFREIFEKAGMSLDTSKNNLILLEGHGGNHPEAYHMYVWFRLKAATEGLSGEAYRKALVDELNLLKKDLEQNPDFTKHLFWRQVIAD